MDEWMVAQTITEEMFLLMVLRHPESDWNEVLIEPEAWMLCLAAVTGARTEH